jgi:hypothetical protein
MQAQITIRFNESEEQAKAFGFLIHSKIGFRGIDRTTITLNESDYLKLKATGIKFEVIDSTKKVGVKEVEEFYGHLTGQNLKFINLLQDKDKQLEELNQKYKQSEELNQNYKQTINDIIKACDNINFDAMCEYIIEKTPELKKYGDVPIVCHKLKNLKSILSKLIV